MVSIYFLTFNRTTWIWLCTI